jgi:hypothetical protein
MLPVIHENVHEPGSDLARARERACEVSIPPYVSAAAEAAVDTSRGTYDESADASRQARRAFRLDEEVNVIVLDGVLKHPEVVSVRGCDSLPEA